MKYILLALSLAVFLILLGTETEARRLPTRHKSRPHNRDTSGTLMVGGRPALQGEAPYLLSLKEMEYDYHQCGASLVEVDGLQIGITTAICIYDDPYIEYYNVVAGDINFADNTGIEQKIRVSRIVVHPDFHSLNNNIAILFLNGSFILNENINTIRLPTSGQVTSQGNLTVSAWGGMRSREYLFDELQIFKLPVINDTSCQKAYEDFFDFVTDDMICTVSPAADLNPCSIMDVLDPGAPAVADAGYLAGVMSYGYRCDDPVYPAVYTKVSHYIDFIESTVASYKKSL